MADIKVSDTDIKTLEIKAESAYALLKCAVEDQDPVQQAAHLSSAECLYAHDLGGSIYELTCPATHSFNHLNKGGRRARKIEAFILQHALMCGQPQRSHEYHMEIAENPDDGMGGLKAFLDAKDDGSSEEGVVFRMIRDRAAQLRNAGKYDLILKAMDYVREGYGKSKD